MPAPDLIAGFYGSDGVLVGVKINGFCVFPFSLGTGLAMQDSSGAWWIVTMGTDGRLSSLQVTF
jgi:hypothetical protein